ncbi:hypothetical protein HAX54_026544 [Datura stramonium]|uniref:Uncharacterized protein n=1 Tax=Datura stramonium TaxID=4076 RepID=A0ABS8V3W3_DATST|nr:hypothetical protein [Datura stramonium]
MASTINTKGEPGTQDESNQHDHLNISRTPDEQGTTSYVLHHDTAEEPELMNTKNSQSTLVPLSSGTLITSNPNVTPGVAVGDAKIFAHDPAKGKSKEGTSGV